MKARYFTLATLLAFGLTAVACVEEPSNSTPSAMCAFVIGDGQEGRDVNIHKIVYPGQPLNRNSETEDLRFVPCNSRNFIINNGTVTNANGDVVGDRKIPIKAYTSTGTPVHLYVSAYWTLNQSPAALNKFYEFCYKYTCASSDDKAGTANFSTPGWNGMLGENFGPTLDSVGQLAASKYPDDIWKKHDATMIAQLALDMSNEFNSKMRAKTGYDVDLFCGSGNSQWPNPNKPGEGEFICTNVRIEVTAVEVADAALGQQESQANAAEQAKAANAQRLEAARQVYGDAAAYWLALQDTLAKCQSENTTCIVTLVTPGADGVAPTVNVTKP